MSAQKPTLDRAEAAYRRGYFFGYSRGITDCREYRFSMAAVRRFVSSALRAWCETGATPSPPRLVDIIAASDARRVASEADARREAEDAIGGHE